MPSPRSSGTGEEPTEGDRTRAIRILAFLARFAEHDAALPHCCGRTARASTRKAPVDGADAEDGAPAQDGAPAPG